MSDPTSPWQPIDTAPRDGRFLLLWCPRPDDGWARRAGDYPPVNIGRWSRVHFGGLPSDPRTGQLVREGWAMPDEDGCECWLRPTYWQPMIEGPPDAS